MAQATVLLAPASKKPSGKNTKQKYHLLTDNEDDHNASTTKKCASNAGNQNMGLGEALTALNGKKAKVKADQLSLQAKTHTSTFEYQKVKDAEDQEERKDEQRDVQLREEAERAEWQEIALLEQEEQKEALELEWIRQQDEQEICRMAHEERMQEFEVRMSLGTAGRWMWQQVT